MELVTYLRVTWCWVTWTSSHAVYVAHTRSDQWGVCVCLRQRVCVFMCVFSFRILIFFFFFCSDTVGLGKIAMCKTLNALQSCSWHTNMNRKNSKADINYINTFTLSMLQPMTVWTSCSRLVSGQAWCHGFTSLFSKIISGVGIFLPFYEKAIF